MKNRLLRDTQKPNWLKTNVLDDISDDFIQELREEIIHDVCLDKSYVFLACDKNDIVDAGFISWPMTSAQIVNRIYRFRLFIAPRSEFLEILKRFELDCNYSYEDRNFYHDISRLINLIDQIVCLDLVEFGGYFLIFSFRSFMDHKTSTKIQTLLLSFDSNLLRCGLEQYIYDWNQEGEQCPIADQVFTDQKLQLWWHP